MSHSSCGCSVKKPDMYIESSCSLVPEYDPGCHDCGGKKTYDKDECVFICRDGQHGDTADVYESCVDDNKDHPVDGSTKENPTWIRRSICEAFRPKPIVEGDGVTKTINQKTGQITYNIAQNSSTVDTNTTYQIVTNNDGTQTFISSDPNQSDQVLNQPTAIPDTDTTCTVTASTDTITGITTVTETCSNALTGEVISQNPVLVLEPGVADTINAISEPNANGKIFITRPDLSVECVYDCATIDKLLNKSECLPSGMKSFALNVPGVEQIAVGQMTPSSVTANGTEFFARVLCHSLTLTTDEYPCLAEAGQEIDLAIFTNIGHTLTAHGNVQPSGLSVQWYPILYLNNASVGGNSDQYPIPYTVDPGQQQGSNASDVLIQSITTTGADLNLEVCHTYVFGPGVREDDDVIGIDTVSVAGLFQPRN